MSKWLVLNVETSEKSDICSRDLLVCRKNDKKGENIL